MKVKVNIINMRCITMSEAVGYHITSLMNTSIVFEESLARDTHTDRQTGCVYLYGQNCHKHILSE